MKKADAIANIVDTAMRSSKNLIEAIGTIEFAKLQLVHISNFAQLKDPKAQEVFKNVIEAYESVLKIEDKEG